MSVWPVEQRGKLINKIFNEFKILWPRKFESQFRDDAHAREVKKAWHRDLPKHFTSEDIERGVRRCHAQLDWPPQLSEFIRLCRPDYDDLKIPPAHTAYVEACKKPSPKDAQAWSHPVVYHTGLSVGWLYLHSTEERFAFPIFRKTYETNVNLLLNGVETFAAPNGKTAKKLAEIPLSREENRRRIAQLKREMFGAAANG